MSAFNKASDIAPEGVHAAMKDAINQASRVAPAVKAVLCEGLLLDALVTEPVTRVEVDSVKAELANIASGAFSDQLIHPGLRKAAQDFYSSRMSA